MQKKYYLLIIITVAFQSYYAQCDSTLVLDIPFDNGGIDLSLYQHHATPSSRLLQNRATDRYNDTATYSWDSITSLMTINKYDNNALKPGLPITFSSWIYLDSLNRSQAIFTNEDRPNLYSGIFISMTPTNELTASLGYGPIGPQSRKTAVTTRTLTSDRWYFITAVYNTGNVIDIYIDGEKEAVTTSGTGSGINYYSNTLYPPTIGKFLSQHLSGKLDNLKMWKRAFDSTEVIDLYNKEKYEKNMVLHRTFSGNTDDISPSNQAGLVLNSQGTIIDTTNQLSMSQSAYYFNDSTLLTGAVSPLSSPINVDFPFSFAIWLTTTDSALAINSMYTNNDRVNRYSGFWVQLNNGKPIISVGNGGAPGPAARRSTFADTILSANKWYQIVFVAESVDSTKIYIDTVRSIVTQSGSAVGISYLNNVGFESVGGLNKGATTRYYQGQIGDIKLWNEAISEDYIKYLYHNNQENIDLLAADTILACSQDSLTLNVSTINPNYSYTWSTGATGPTEKGFIDTTGGIICLTATDSLGNTISDRLVIEVLDPADTSITITNDTLTSNDTTVTYRWLDCNNNYAAINGASQRTFTPTVNGSYAVELTKMNLCKDTSACVVINITSLSKNSLSNQFYSIYPNPANDQLFIKGQDLNELSIRIFDQTGKIVLNEKNYNQSGVSLSSLSNGMYWLELSNGENRLRTKFVIAK